MREMGTESPVIWPAWCYSGETGGDGDIPSQSATPISGSAKTRTKRNGGSAATPSVNDSTSTKLNGDFQHSNNNNSIKNERLSPASYAATPDNSSRSRSVTPSSSSVPGTPPGTEHTALSGRNYSDIMRSLAAKYNNNNPNEYFNPSIRNGLLDRGFTQGFKSSTTYPNPLSPISSSVLNVNTNSTKDVCDSSPHKKTDLFHGNIPLFPAMIDMSSTQALLALVRQAKQDELHKCLKRSASVAETNSSPLDLSSAGGVSVISSKRSRTSSKSISKRSESESPEPTSVTTASTPLILASKSSPCLSTPRVCIGQCTSNSEILSWTVDDVVNFVSSIDICAEYAENFRDQRIDGAGLPLLTEEHLTRTMRMKLGPALKLKALIYKKMGSCALCLHCVHCHKSTMEQSVQSSPNDTSPTLKQERRPSSNS